MNIRPFVCLLLMMGRSVVGDGSDPLALLTKARETETKKHDFKKALALAEEANAIWDGQGAKSVDYARSLTLAAMLVVRESAGSPEPLAIDRLNRAIEICRANQATAPEDLALALEVKAFSKAGEQMQQTAEWREAAGIRGGLVSEGLPIPTGSESPAIRLSGGADNVIAAKPISKVRPDYTEAGRVLRIRGKVIMSVIIEADGKPSSGSLTKGLGFGLDEEAAKAVRQWRFQPASKDGAAVRMRATIETNFKLL
jgi:TonB family protein